MKRQLLCLSLVIFAFVRSSVIDRENVCPGPKCETNKCRWPCKDCDTVKSREFCTACNTDEDKTTSVVPKYLMANKGECQYKCDDGFTTDGYKDFTCHKCHESCDGCHDWGKFGDAKSCIKCAKDYPFRTWDKQACFKSCPAGTILETSKKTCKQCKSGCKTCGPTADTCTSCDDRQKLWRGECVYECPSGFFTVNNKCEPCASPCSTCINKPTYCLTCNGLKNLRKVLDGTCYQSCPKGTTPAPKSAWCHSDKHPLPDFTKSAAVASRPAPRRCKRGTILIDDDCVKCESPCSTCFTTTDTCTACDPDGERTFVYKSRCYQRCPAQTVPNSDNASCRSETNDEQATRKKDLGLKREKYLQKKAKQQSQEKEQEQQQKRDKERAEKLEETQKRRQAEREASFAKKEVKCKKEGAYYDKRRNKCATICLFGANKEDFPKLKEKEDNCKTTGIKCTRETRWDKYFKQCRDRVLVWCEEGQYWSRSKDRCKKIVKGNCMFFRRKWDIRRQKCLDECTSPLVREIRDREGICLKIISQEVKDAAQKFFGRPVQSLSRSERIFAMRKGKLAEKKQKEGQ